MKQRNFNTNLTKIERLKIAERVKALRKSTGLSQKDFAEQIGVASNRILEIENGTKDFRIDTLLAILLKHGLTLGDFVPLK